VLHGTSSNKKAGRAAVFLLAISLFDGQIPARNGAVPPGGAGGEKLFSKAAKISVFMLDIC
jgi:hypothetical protein